MRWRYVCLPIMLARASSWGQTEMVLPQQQLAIDKEPARTAATARPQSHNPARTASLTDWTIVDSMTNVFGMASYELNPFSYSPGIDLLAIVHRGDIESYAAAYTTGALYYNISSDGGLTWPRMPDPLNQNDSIGDTIAARYPSSSVMVPTSNRGDAWFFAGYPNLTLYQSFGNAGGAYDFPIFTNAPNSYTFHEDTVRSFASLACTFASDSVMFVASEMSTPAGGYYGTAFFHTRTWGISVQNYLIPPGLDTNHIAMPGSSLGGDAINTGGVTKIAFATGAYFYRYKDPGDTSNIVTPQCIGVVYSTNQGETWTGWNGLGFIDTVILANIPELGIYKYWWRWQNFSNRIGGDMCLDSLGYPHCVIGVQTNPIGTGINVAIAEIYRNVTGWHGKIVAPANPYTNYVISTIYGSLNQSGYSPFIARNNEGTVFACQYNNSPWPDNNSDIFVTARRLNAQNWNTPINITNTPNEPGNTFSEVLSHFSNKMRHDSANYYTVWSAYADPIDHTGEIGTPSGTYIRCRAVHLNVAPWPPECLPLTWLNPPPYGYIITKETTFTAPSVIVRSCEELPSDSIRLKVRILDSQGSELAVWQLTIPYIPFGGRDTILTFVGGGFTPPDTGRYTVQCIAQGINIFGVDTSITYLYVIIPAPITRSQVRKVYSAYTEITGGTPGPIGDDADMRFALPFQFMYDNVWYDSLNISTNGWLQFGKAGFRPDSLPYGLSHPMGNAEGNANRIGFDTRPPLHVASPWWEDLNTNISGDPTAGVSYTVDGTAPNRILTIQWKSMLAYYDSTTTSARINFQAKLHENKNMLEFVYGNIQAGAYGGTDTGAAISLKDATGGAYHYFDVYERRSGQPSDGNTLLNPLVNWPGPDSAYQIWPNSVCVPLSYDSKWNLISLPVIRLDSNLHSIFPTAISLCRYTTHYDCSDTILVPGKGYWARFQPPVPNEICGASLPTVDISVIAGWNLIGSVDHAIPAPTGGMIVSPFYGYHHGYAAASSISPRSAYWVKVSSGGTLMLGPSTEPKQPVMDIEAFNSVTFTDNAGRSQKLFFTEDRSKSIDLSRYEMPPPPPAGIFDARFASQRILESFIDNGTHEFPILLSSAEYPLTVSADIKNSSLEASLNFNGKKIRLGANSPVQISNLQSHITLIIAGGRELPTTFALHQNYPNPFNPITRIRYDMPKSSKVLMKIYNILGQEVRTLVDEVQEAGYKTVVLDASNYSSGVYFYRMNAGNFIETRKLILTR